MTSFLLLVSFLIHLLLIIAVYHLYDKLKQTKTAQADELKEMLASFMEEIREENQKLEENLRKERESRHIRDHVARTRLMSESELKQSYSKGPKEEPLMPPPEIQAGEQVETSLESKVLQLKQEGKSVEEIAKQLNRGKTEIDLLLKLHQK